MHLSRWAMQTSGRGRACRIMRGALAAPALVDSDGAFSSAVALMHVLPLEGLLPRDAE